MRTKEIKNEVNEIKKWKEKIKWKALKYETKKYMHDFQQYEMMKYFVDSIYTRKANTVKAEANQNNLLNNIVEFKSKFRPRSKEDKDKKEIFMNLHMLLMRVEN